MKLNNFQLKLIAITLMTLSHIQYHIGISNLLYIGQASWPIFAYLSVYAIDKTRNILHYILRVLIFGIVLQIPLIYMQIDYINIFITIAFGLFAILSFKLRNPVVSAAIILIAHLYNFDYGAYGISLMMCIYIFKYDIKYFAISLLLLNITFINFLEVFSIYQWFSIFSIPLLALYNGERGKYKAKYLFYIYYPLHISIIYLIANHIN